MSLLNRFIISLYFPQFKESQNSRFESFFNKLIPKSQKNQNCSYLIYPDKIIQGLDKRSSIELRYIPKTWNKNFIRDIVESFGNINFLFLNPRHINSNNKSNTLTAYVNYINYRSIVNVFMYFNKKIKSNTLFDSTKINNLFMNNNDIDIINIGIQVWYSKIQGKENFIHFFKGKNE